MNLPEGGETEGRRAGTALCLCKQTLAPEARESQVQSPAPPRRPAEPRPLWAGSALKGLTGREGKSGCTPEGDPGLTPSR